MLGEEELEQISDDELAETATSEPARHRVPEQWEIVGVSDDDRYLIVTAGETPDGVRTRIFDARIDVLYPEAPLGAQLDGAEERTLTNAERERILERAGAAMHGAE